MNIVLVHNATIPAHKYGGTERVVWDLAKELYAKGHDITFIVSRDSEIPFGRKIAIEEVQDITKAIPAEADVVHFHSGVKGMEELDTPFIFTLHGNIPFGPQLHRNTVFVSKNQAERYGSGTFVHNGLDWSAYEKPDLTVKRTHFHFLGKGAWRIKNLHGAIEVIRDTPHEKLYVLGGVRFNINMGLRFTFTPRAKFFGMVGNRVKSEVMNTSKGLVFPVLWNEPFGLAVIESLYFGCPVFGTPYGALPELVNEEVGFLSNSRSELSDAVQNSAKFSREICHQHAREQFNSALMADRYLEMYAKVMDGEILNRQYLTLLKEEPKFLEWNK